MDGERTRWTLPDFGGKGDRVEERTSRSRAPTTRQAPAPRAPAPRTSNRQSVTEAAIKSVVRSVGSTIGRELVRGILGSLKKGR